MARRANPIAESDDLAVSAASQTVFEDCVNFRLAY